MEAPLFRVREEVTFNLTAKALNTPNHSPPFKMTDTEIILESLHENIAPQLIGNPFAKRIIALQLFTNPQIEKIHILLVGDAQSGKSTLGNDISQITPRSGYVDALKATPVGFYEKAQACNGGILVFDEMDKGDKKVCLQLLEIMQLGRISVDKHDMHYTLDAKINILSICNPKRCLPLNPDIPILQQVPFSLPLMSRFHIILPFYNVESHNYEAISINMRKNMRMQQRKEAMYDYISKVRESIPIVEIPEKICEQIGELIRRIKEKSRERAMIGPRLIDGGQSMICATARMHGRNKASQEDFEYIKKILEKIFIENKL